MQKKNSYLISLLSILITFTQYAVGTPIKVLLLGGQSNSVGQTLVTALPAGQSVYQSPQSDIMFYYRNEVASPALTTLRPGSGGGTVGTANAFGPELSFGRKIADAQPAEQYAIIKHGENGTSLAFNWFPDNGVGGYMSGTSYSNFQTTVTNGLAALVAAGYQPEIVGMFWMQGESDALNPSSTSTYQTRLTNFIADIRTRYGANVTFVMGEITRQFTANGVNYDAGFTSVADDLAAIAAADANNGFAQGADLVFYDDIHFDAPSTVTLGERMATAYLDIVSPQTALSATEESATTELAYASDVSDTDLLHGLTPVASGWILSSSGRINDGVHGENFTTAGNVVEGGYSAPNSSVEYSLGLGANGLGYDINSIQTIASWSGGSFSNQVWTVEVKPAGGSWTTLDTVDYQPHASTAGPSSTKVILANSGSTLATGIEAIRFSTQSVAGNATNSSVIREIDVFGVASGSAVKTQIFSEDFENSPDGAIDLTTHAFSFQWGGTSFTTSVTALTIDVKTINSPYSNAINNLPVASFTGGRFYGALGFGQNAQADTAQTFATGATYELNFLQYKPKNTPNGARAITAEIYDVSTSAVLATQTFAGVNDFDNPATRTLSFTATAGQVANNIGIRFTADSVDYDDAATTTFNENNLYGTAIDNIELCESGATAPTGIIVDCEHSTTELNYASDVSSTDLLQGITPSQPGQLHPNPYNKVTNASSLTDGIHGGTFNINDPLAVITANPVPNAIVEYRLGYGDNGTGYNISSIQSIAAWAGADFGNQAWSVEVKPVGGDWTNLADVSCQPFNSSAIGATKVTVSDSSGANIATGIERIRFTANSVTNIVGSGAFQWREIDVFGSSTPAEATPAAPLVSSMSPSTVVNGSICSNISTKTKLVATFDKPVQLGSGNITLINLDTGAQTVMTIPNSQVTVDATEPTLLMITPSAELDADTRYAVQIDASAIDSLSGASYAGIADSTTWTFTTRNANPLRILCIGDSITVGYTEVFDTDPYKSGYRSHLYNLLNNAGYIFQYVGSSNQPYGNSLGGDPTIGGTYKPEFDLRDIGQDFHQGGGGATIPVVQAALAGNEADLVLLKVGINSIQLDANGNYVNTIATLKSNIFDVAKSVLDTNATVKLVVAQTIPYVNTQTVRNAQLYLYNRYIRDELIPDLITAGYDGNRVRTADMYSMFLTDPSDHSSAVAPERLSNNYNHPWNEAYQGAGYDTMAQQWFDAIESFNLTSNNHFACWVQNTNYGLSPSDQGFDLDPDGDSLSNGIEAFFGTNPGEHNAGIAMGAASNTTATFSHPQNSAIPNDLVWEYQWSLDLDTWYTADGVDGPVGGARVTATPNTSGTSTTVTATVDTAQTKVFYRIKVNQN